MGDNYLILSREPFDTNLHVFRLFKKRKMKILIYLVK